MSAGFCISLLSTCFIYTTTPLRSQKPLAVNCFLTLSPCQAPPGLLTGLFTRVLQLTPKNTDESPGWASLKQLTARSEKASARPAMLHFQPVFAFFCFCSLRFPTTTLSLPKSLDTKWITGFGGMLRHFFCHLPCHLMTFSDLFYLTHTA